MYIYCAVEFITLKRRSFLTKHQSLGIELELLLEAQRKHV